jgi:hypothetical protein
VKVWQITLSLALALAVAACASDCPKHDFQTCMKPGGGCHAEERPNNTFTCVAAASPVHSSGPACSSLSESDCAHREDCTSVYTILPMTTDTIFSACN